MAKFKQGQSGNPAGKPAGARDKRTELRELLKPHADDLVRKVVQMALAGDTTALRICIDRLIPPVRESAIKLTLPPSTDIPGCLQAQATVLDAVSTGELLPGEGQALSALIENQRRSLETENLEQRLKTIEDKLGVRP
jgi:hypothetical protein